MSKIISLYGFTGMDNIKLSSSRLLNDLKQATPSLVKDADVFDDGFVKKRAGHGKRITLTNCHSLWADTVMLCVASGAGGTPALHRIDGNEAIELGAVYGDAPFSFAEVEGHVYLGNGVCSRVYEVASGTLRTWGLGLPPMPTVDPVAGNLPPGKYSICYTMTDTTRNNRLGAFIGGAGPVLTFFWEGGSSGIRLLNRPSAALCWMTLPDGDEMLLARLDSEDIVDLPTAQPLPTLDVAPPPPFGIVEYAHGRMWGTYENWLYVSDEFRPEWFRSAAMIVFPQTLTLLAPIHNGVFVSSLTDTWLLEGTDPEKARVTRVGEGALPGSLTYVQVAGERPGISHDQSQLPSPVWLSSHGIVVGTNAGHLLHVTENRLNMRPMGKGAALYRHVDGVPQVVTTYR